MNQLFERVPGESDGPSIGELYRQCPTQFRQPDNEWNRFAADSRRGGGADGTKWRPRSKDPEVVTRQMGCFLAITATTVMDNSPVMQRMQDAVAAWMLHEMLAELPIYVPLDRTK